MAVLVPHDLTTTTTTTKKKKKNTREKNALRDTHTHERECVVSIVSKFNTTLRLREEKEKEDAEMMLDARRNALKRGGGDEVCTALWKHSGGASNLFSRRRTLTTTKNFGSTGQWRESCWRKKSPRKNTEKTRRINRRTWKRKRVCEKMPSPQDAAEAAQRIERHRRQRTRELKSSERTARRSEGFRSTRARARNDDEEDVSRDVVVL